MKGTLLTDYRRRLLDNMYEEFVARYGELLAAELPDERPSRSRSSACGCGEARLAVTVHPRIATGTPEANPPAFPGGPRSGLAGMWLPALATGTAEGRPIVAGCRCALKAGVSIRAAQALVQDEVQAPGPAAA